jgi:hypothetical protein
MIETIVNMYRMQVGGDPAKNAFIIALFLFMILGFAVLIYGIFLSVKLKKAASWPVANGVITDSGAYNITKNNQDVRPRTLYAADLRFTYAVDGQQFISDKVHWGAVRVALNFGNYVENKLEKYPVGKEIKVHYNQTNPSDCVVELNHGFEMVVPYIFGLCAIIFSGSCIFSLFAPRALQGLPFAYFFALVCLVAFLKFVVPLYKIDFKKPGWQNVWGTVQNVEVLIDNPNNMVVTEKSSVYYAQAAYDYEIGEKKYSGKTRLGYLNSKDFAESYKKDYESGRQIRLLINPANPSESFINTRLVWMAIVLTVFLCLFIIIVPIVVTNASLSEYKRTSEQRR